MRQIQILEQGIAQNSDQIILSDVTYRDSQPFSGIFDLPFYDDADGKAPLFQTATDGPWMVDVFCKVEGECVDEETVITLQLTKYPFITEIVTGGGLDVVKKIGWVNESAQAPTAS